MRGPQSIRTAAIILLATAVASCGSERVTQELTGSTMGTSFRIQIVNPDKALDTEFLTNDVSMVLKDIEESMSTYLHDSEVSRFNATAANQWFDVSAGLCEVIEGAQTISALSG
jgi:thiamine biosynthesis lipoprotein